MINVRKTVTILRSPEDVYGFWRDLENLPRFMHHLETVEVTGDGRSHWIAKGPAGKRIEWDAQIVDDVPGALLSWRSLPGADVRNAGVVRFRQAPGDRGTEVVVDLTYDAPGGPVGAAIARLLGEDPREQLSDDLRRFKQVLEDGELVHSDGRQGDGQGALKQRPAQPPRESVSESRL